MSKKRSVASKEATFEAVFESDANANKRLAPVLVSFPQGPPPVSALRPNSSAGEKSTTFDMYHAETDISKKIVKGVSDKMVYIGKNFEEDAFDEQPTKFVIGVCDKKSGKVRLIECDHVFRMNQFLIDKVAVEAEQELTTNERYASLVSNFGSNKAQKIKKHRETYALESSADKFKNVKVSKQIEQFEQSKAEEDETLATRRKRLPKFNLLAEKPEDIYDVEDIAPKKVLDSLAADALKEMNEYAQDLKRVKTLLSDNKYPLFVTDRLYRIAKAKPDEEERERLCKYLLLIAEMIKLHNLSSKSFKKAPQMQDLKNMAPLIYEHFCSTFSENYFQTPDSKDKLRLHILALALIIDKFDVLVDLIASDLHITGEVATTYFKELGAKPVIKSGANSALKEVHAVLTAPLTFPVQRTSLGAKRK